ncbi:MAG: RDD family protein [Pyrinomonadaceae bacterium]
MASAAQRALATTKTSDAEKIVDFSPEALRAPFALRCAALSIDYIILLIFPAGWLTLGKLFGEGNATALGTTIWVVGVAFFLANFLLLPFFRGQSIGKMLTGITILNSDGTSLSFGRLFIRNTIGYLITISTVGLGFVISAVNTSGRTLHDLLSGTIVVHGRKKQL